MAAHFEIPLVLIESLRAARHVAALTGSGISAESGIPTEGPHPLPPLLTTASRGVVRRGEQCTLLLFSRLRFSSQEKRLGSEVYNTDAFIHNGQPL
jgi:hypothetical protein